MSLSLCTFYVNKIVWLCWSLCAIFVMQQREYCSGICDVYVNAIRTDGFPSCLFSYKATYQMVERLRKIWQHKTGNPSLMHHKCLIRSGFPVSPKNSPIPGKLWSHAMKLERPDKTNPLIKLQDGFFFTVNQKWRRKINYLLPKVNNMSSFWFVKSSHSFNSFAELVCVKTK